MIRSKYKTQFKPVEAVHLTDEMSTYYVDEIMIRSYLYSKRRKKVRKFNEFIEEFAHPSLNDAHRDSSEIFLKMNSKFNLKIQVKLKRS